ncbi:MAG TPA: MBL fold metallo-hydrolase [Candidatus Limnocylindrales bacterium]|nr:MBL fold metallo-hydrolase [Candidatus Limnocylindrales bacterium]
MSRNNVWAEVADRVFVRRYDTWLGESFDQNVGVVLGMAGAVVVDTRASHLLADELRSELRDLTKAPVAAVVNTHHHWDHTFGNARFVPAPIWGHRRCAERVLEDGDTMRRRVIGEAPEAAEQLEGVVLTPPNQVFEETALVDLGDRQLQLTYLGRGHTDNDIVIVVPDAGVLFAGDLLENDAPPGYGDAYPAAWATTATERLLPLVKDLVVPGHGTVGDRGFAHAQAADLQAMAALGAQVAAGTLDEDEATRLAPFPARTAKTAFRRSAVEALGALAH